MANRLALPPAVSYGHRALRREALDWAFERVKDVFQTIERIAGTISSQTDLGHGAA